jgi:uncharacterized OB-fold protein
MSDVFPTPAPANSDDAAFWTAVHVGELRIQRCRECGVYRHPPRPVCARCSSRASDWPLVSGNGEVWSYTVIHPPTLPAFSARTPYAAVVVRLDEGVFLVSNLVECPVEDIQIGTRVQLAITDIEGVALPLFRPAR